MRAAVRSFRLAVSLGLLLIAVVSGSLLMMRSPAALADDAGGQRSIVRFTHDGLARAYIVHVPASSLTESPAPAPLLVMLHGQSQRAADAEAYTGFNSVAGRSKAIVVYGSGYAGSWNAGTCCGSAVTNNNDDVGYLDEVIAQVTANFYVNTTRVYVAGFSSGGMMAYRYACERPQSVTAVAVVSGTLVSSNCRPGRSVSLIQVHGAKDQTVPYAGTAYSSNLRSPLRSVPSASAGFANQIGCSTRATSSQPNSEVIRYDYPGCPSRVHARVYRSAPLGHAWVRSASTYGFDTTALVWSFLSPHYR